MNDKLFIGIPCYQDTPKLHQTLGFLKERSVLPNSIHVHIEKQSVVKNKNCLLREARALGASYVCLCDDDIEPEHGWDAKLLEGINQASKKGRVRVGQTSPRFVLPNGEIFSFWHNVTIYPGLPVSCSIALRETDTGVPVLDNPMYHQRFFVGAVAGTLTIFTRSFLETVDWQFDDRYVKSQWEDLDQSLTCRLHGFEVLYNGMVRVIHHTEASHPRAIVQNRILFSDKWNRHAELTRVVNPTAEGITRAIEEFEGKTKPNSLLSTILTLVTRHPLRRLRTAGKLLVTSGFSGLQAHMKRILDEANETKRRNAVKREE